MRIVHDTLQLVSRRGFEVHDVTAAVAERVRAAALEDGLVHVASRHTTAAVTVNEFEPNLMQDLERWLGEVAPAGRGWRHDALARSMPSEPANTHAHLGAMLLGHSQTVAVAAGSLQLGTWQRLLLVELDGPRRRTAALTMCGRFGSGGR